MSEKMKYEHSCGHSTKNRADMWTHLETCPTRTPAREISVPEPTYTASQVQEMKNAWVDEVAKNVQEYFASGEAIDNCANEKELDNWRYIREIAEFIREMKI